MLIKILITLIAIEDTVLSLEKNGKDFLVLFQGKAGVYHLKHDSKNFDDTLIKLQKSNREKKKVKIEADIQSLEIK